jgi:hypothetical protein
MERLSFEPALMQGTVKRQLPLERIFNNFPRKMPAKTRTESSLGTVVSFLYQQENLLFLFPIIILTCQLQRRCLGSLVLLLFFALLLRLVPPILPTKLFDKYQ